MDGFDVDLFVIGAGSGGVRAARTAAALGARVAIAETGRIGGTCVNVGCIPKKLFVYAADCAGEFRDAVGFGWQPAEAAFDWATLRDAVAREITRLNGIYRSLLEARGVALVEGRARLLDPHTVAVGGRNWRARHILVATGAWPRVPEIPGREHLITSNEFFSLPARPRRALLIGGGYIAVELAGVLHALGTETTLLYRGPLFLRHFDQDLRRVLAEEMRALGMRLEFDTDVERIERAADGSLEVVTHDGRRFPGDAVLAATGRHPLTQDLGLEDCGVRLDANGAIEVDHHYRSTVPSIHALGDVIGGPELTPLATAQAMALVSTLFGGEARSVGLQNLPTAIFSRPEVATVGLSEERARASVGAVRVFETRFRPLRNTLSGNPGRVYMKLVVDAETDRVLGAHMVGPEAGEIIQGLAVALQAGATKRVFDATIGIHPTAAEEFVTMREAVR
ncbi:MAG: Glutathione amide reductase [Pseudomonadales bacterium]|nr:Glutathione amide reductase [Pseudomonadales bacterium]